MCKLLDNIPFKQMIEKFIKYFFKNHNHKILIRILLMLLSLVSVYRLFVDVKPTPWYEYAIKMGNSLLVSAKGKQPYYYKSISTRDYFLGLIEITPGKEGSVFISNQNKCNMNNLKFKNLCDQDNNYPSGIRYIPKGNNRGESLFYYVTESFQKDNCSIELSMTRQNIKGEVIFEQKKDKSFGSTFVEKANEYNQLIIINQWSDANKDLDNFYYALVTIAIIVMVVILLTLYPREINNNNSISNLILPPNIHQIIIPGSKFDLKR